MNKPRPYLVSGFKNEGGYVTIKHIPSEAYDIFNYLPYLSFTYNCKQCGKEIISPICIPPFMQVICKSHK